MAGPDPNKVVIFVGGMPPKNTSKDYEELKKELVSLFSSYGSPTAADVDVHSTKNKQHTVGVVAVSKDKADEAIKALNGTEFQGRKIQVKLSGTDWWPNSSNFKKRESSEHEPDTAPAPAPAAAAKPKKELPQHGTENQIPPNKDLKKIEIVTHEGDPDKQGNFGVQIYIRNGEMIGVKDSILLISTREIDVDNFTLDPFPTYRVGKPTVLIESTDFGFIDLRIRFADNDTAQAVLTVVLKSTGQKESFLLAK